MSVSKMLVVSALTSLVSMSAFASNSACEATCKVIKAHAAAAAPKLLNKNMSEVMAAVEGISSADTAKGLTTLAIDAGMNPLLLKKLTSCYPVPSESPSIDAIASIMFAAKYTAGVSAGIASCSGQIGN